MIGTALLASSVPVLSNRVVLTSMAEKKNDTNIVTYWQISGAVVEQNKLLEWQRENYTEITNVVTYFRNPMLLYYALVPLLSHLEWKRKK